MKIKILTAISYLLFIYTNTYGQTLSNELVMAIKYADTKKLDKLIDDKTLNTCFDIADNSYNYLSTSIKMKSLESLEYFIRRGANLEGVCKGKTPLMYAVEYGQLDNVKFLLKEGANIDTQYKGRTALVYAVKYRKKKIVDFIVAYKKNQ